MLKDKFPKHITDNPNFIRYQNQLLDFQKKGGAITHLWPILDDYQMTAGQSTGHYFHQDLLVANLIYKHNPIRHIDIGSRIDGFVAHVASFRQIEVSDIREMENSGHSNISFIRADLMSPVVSNITDSISCLHAIEHFGLGRYGDNIDPKGHIKGFNNIIRMLKKNGRMYISFPIGKTNSVHFNAHRVFHPTDIFNWQTEEFKINLLRFDYVDDDGKLHQNIDLNSHIPKVDYGCGIYTFIKNN